MKYQDFLKVVIAAAVGAAIGGGAVFYLKTPREIPIPHVVTGPETVRLLVAKQALSYGATIDVTVDGAEADALMAALDALIANRFGEER